MKVVLDSMMWVSYCTHPDGPRATAIENSIRQRVRLFVSEFMLAEIARVMDVKLVLPRRFIDRSVRSIRRRTTTVDIPECIPQFVPADPDDNPIIQTAISGKSDLIVTADKVLLEIGKIQDIEIIDLDEYVVRLASLPG